MVIDIVPIWFLFMIVAGLALVAVEIGFRWGRAVKGKSDNEEESAASSVSGVIIGLLAFMLAFTFSIFSDRYDSKKDLVRQEANTIRTAYHRADFLQEPDRTNSKAIMGSYVDQRLAIARSYDPELALRTGDDALKMQEHLWDIAVVNGRLNLNSDIGALYVQSINDIASVHARRIEIGIHARVPTIIWGVLLSILVLGMLGIGYHTAMAESRRFRVTPILAVAFSPVISVVAALGHPGDALLPISQQALIEVQKEINTPPESTQLDP